VISTDTASTMSPALEHLRLEFGDRFSEEAIECCVHETEEGFRGSRISVFVPLLVERLSRKRLRAFDAIQSCA
jgi:hypothetical protein